MNQHLTAAAPLPQAGIAALLGVLLRRRGAPGPVPALTHELASLDVAHVEQYRQALGFEQPGVPLSYAYLLVQRAHLAVLRSPGFDHPIAGLIHAGNRLAQTRALALGMPVHLHSELMLEPLREDGAQFLQLRTRLTQDGQEALVCESRYLARRGQSASRSRGRPEAPPLPEGLASWTLDAAAGRRYARLSGDWNPIHLWDWTARRFGLPGAIIHGACSAARAQAGLERALGRPVQRLNVEFLRPILLGREVTLQADRDAGAFELRVQGQRALLGDWA